MGMLFECIWECETVAFSVLCLPDFSFEDSWLEDDTWVWVSTNETVFTLSFPRNFDECFRQIPIRENGAEASTKTRFKNYICKRFTSETSDWDKRHETREFIVTDIDFPYKQDEWDMADEVS